jgi:ABC-type transport system substrate-binding protein
VQGADPKNPKHWPEGLKITGERTVSLTLARPDQFATDALADVWLIPRELEGCEDQDDLKQPVGTGPFRFTGPPGEELNLVRAPGRWGGGPEALPYLDGVRLGSRTEPEVALSALARGELDVVVLSLEEARRLFEFDAEGRPHLAGRFAGIHASIAANVLPGFSLGAIYPLHRAGSALATPEVRRALALALDREKVTRAYAVAHSQPFGALLDPAMLGVDPALRPFGEDLAEAEKLLASIGHPHGQGLPEITLAHAPLRAAAAQEISAEAARVGLKVRPVELSLSAIAEAASTQSVDSYLGFNFYRMHGAEPAWYLESIVRRCDRWGFPVAGTLELLARAKAEPDRAARGLLWRELSGKLFDAEAVIPLSKSRDTIDTFAAYFVISPRVHGLDDPLSGQLPIDQHRFAKVWLSP